MHKARTHLINRHSHILSGILHFGILGLWLLAARWFARLLDEHSFPYTHRNIEFLSFDGSYLNWGCGAGLATALLIGCIGVISLIK